MLYGESGIYAIEVKNARRADSSDFTSLRSFAEGYPQSRRYLLYRGEDRLTRDGVLCMPCEEFLRALRPNSFPDLTSRPYSNISRTAEGYPPCAGPQSWATPQPSATHHPLPPHSCLRCPDSQHRPSSPSDSAWTSAADRARAWPHSPRDAIPFDRPADRADAISGLSIRPHGPARAPAPRHSQHPRCTPCHWHPPQPHADKSMASPR